MTNYRRNYVEGGTVFFIVITYRRRPIMTSLLAREALQNAIQDLHRRRPFALDAIVLLPDQLHTIWTLPPDDEIYSTRWRQIKTPFTRDWLLQGGVRRPSQSAEKSKGSMEFGNAVFLSIRVATKTTQSGVSTTYMLNP